MNKSILSDLTRNQNTDKVIPYTLTPLYDMCMYMKLVHDRRGKE